MAHETTHNEAGELEMSCTLHPHYLLSAVDTDDYHSLSVETQVLIPMFERCARASVRCTYAEL